MPFSFSPSVALEDREVLRRQMQRIEQRSCVKGNKTQKAFRSFLSPAHKFREFGDADAEYDLYHDHLVISVKENFNCILCKSLGARCLLSYYPPRNLVISRNKT